MNRDATPPRERRILPAIGCCLLLGVAQYFLYRVNFTQFFQGDALFWMYYRFRSLPEFFHGLGSLDVGNWYRPLSNRTIPSLFYSVFGLRPYGYHLVVFTIFFLTSCTLFAFLKRLTGSVRLAFLAAFYFSIHSINVYTTFDFAFAPELLYGLFYICAAWFFVEWERDPRSRWYAASVSCFVLSLMSKEAAVTLPAVLVSFHLLYVHRGIAGALRAVWLHLLVLAVYLGAVVGYLSVGSGDYMLTFHRNVATNFVTAAYYVFNLRRDGLMPTRAVPFLVLAFLVAFALFQFLIAAKLLFRSERKAVLFGLSWFTIAIFPMTMLRAVSPYYAFLPLAGVSLVIGAGLDAAYRYLEARRRKLGTVVMAAVLAMIWVSCRLVIVSDTANDTALGYAARWSSNAATDMLTAHPRLPDASNIYILDESVPDLFRYGISSLFKLLYDDTVSTSYRSQGESVRTANGDRSIVMKAEAEHLIDVTDDFYRNPARFITEVADSDFEYEQDARAQLRVDPAEVVIGRDFYWLSVEGFQAEDVTVQYTINGGPVAEATLRLNPSGKIRFFVSDLTTAGLYEFLRFKSAAPASKWIKSSAALRVVPHPQP